MRILVIEDTPKHLEDAKKFFATQPDVEVMYASTFYQLPAQLMRHVKNRSKDPPVDLYDGVISDIFFPTIDGYPGDQPEPIGVAVMMLCHEFKIPCILCTAGYHHGFRYQWIDWLQRILDLPPMFDRVPPYDPYTNQNTRPEADEKSWKRAFEALKELIAKRQTP